MNDEIRMTNDERSPNDEARMAGSCLGFVIRHSDFVIFSSFVIRNSSFTRWCAGARQRALVHSYTRLATAAFALCFLLVVPKLASAAEERGISVTGTGEVKARPNRLEIELQASGAAELTGDAIIKYDDSLRRVTEAFDRLKMENLSVEQGDLSFAATITGNARVVNVAVRTAQAKPHTAIAQSLKVTLRNVDQLSQKELVATVGKLIDTAQDAGATIGGNPGGNAVINQINQFGQVIVQNQVGRPVVAFLLDDFEALHDQAYQKAFEDAQARAQKLAKLAHATLGEVISIDENQQMYYGAGGTFQQSLASIRLSEIPVRVSLRVRFELLRARGATEQAALEK